MRCFNDGFDFIGPPVTYPLRIDRAGTVTMSDTVFCSLACVRRHLLDNAPQSPHLLALMTRVHGCPAAASSRNVLAAYSLSGTGISIEEYRSPAAGRFIHRGAAGSCFDPTPTALGKQVNSVPFITIGEKASNDSQHIVRTEMSDQIQT